MISDAGSGNGSVDGLRLCQFVGRASETGDKDLNSIRHRVDIAGENGAIRFDAESAVAFRFQREADDFGIRVRGAQP